MPAVSSFPGGIYGRSTEVIRKSTYDIPSIQAVYLSYQHGTLPVTKPTFLAMQKNHSPIAPLSFCMKS
ncbi:hypothetical protein BABINDRAFT_160983 [Babjeviella inositovora NRRL Y-12698]|uniref:Uncharacterized protein n=1 Tax=Babjeviella inositovora NRRL Y-12698 TaxID=984486 RepID=A0A1E3QSU9_9ASCO|nr:uncharacterized protein BABINDRAFT_160983 [Babjeviella inositovora NRRL Y-12698]ODQ80769.1 hypothetical protein BABINDRAFT_160983 [Babjeviella inositovora NRRL Y-12698]